MLKFPSHKPVQDVSTRWNSSHVMLERFLEQQDHEHGSDANDINDSPIETQNQ
jgi:hypothetical protein